MPLRSVKPQLQIILIGFIFGCPQLCSGDDYIEKTLEHLFVLPIEVNESSGIIINDSLLWTFNDSGNNPVLFGLDLRNGAIKKRIHINNAGNNDWEDITQDNHTIFIGDIGNNSGSRQDLSILLIEKDSINADEIQHINVKRINYSYPDQKEFTEQAFSTEYDCEALFYFNDSLYLLTKNWVEETTSLYQLPKTPGTYRAKKILDFNSDGLISGADHNRFTNELVICGYKQYVPFIILFENAQTLKLNNLVSTRFEFFNEFGVQIEGISFFNNTIYLSSENSAHDQAFYRFENK